MSDSTAKPAPTQQSIRREYLGGTESLTFAEFAERVIQDDEIAEQIAEQMLRSPEPYDHNSEEPEFFERFTVIDRDHLRRELQELQ